MHSELTWGLAVRLYLDKTSGQIARSLRGICRVDLEPQGSVVL
ncbi:hypothetical protein NSPZN2_30687 [Nitrospira defluvii]|uniref:Uncharacterized protein n=1 Tax=Nitrospira defluvii TaxID=330214 RepID=A0ABN7LP63_9BACT|nr:hypothetical protein NSPZN2_30687 [Nitrospira defluvii]